MIYLFAAFIVFCILIWAMPSELTKVVLMGTWALMAMWAVAVTLYSIGSIIMK